jgi:hypothetical protein
LALAHVASTSVWRDDLAVLRGLAWIGNGRSGGLSMLLVQASFLVPIGSLYFRASLLAALALGASGLAIFVLVRRILRLSAEAPRLSAAFASIAALMVTLGATGQREGTVAGGGAPALLVATLVLVVASGAALSAPRRALAVGMLLGTLAGESVVVASALATGLGLSLLLGRERIERIGAGWAAGGALAAAAIVFAPTYVRPLASRSFLDLGRSVAALGPAILETPVRPLGGAGALLDGVGRVALALALAGSVIGLVRARLRTEIAPLVTVVLLDVLASSKEGALLSTEELAPLHLVALSFLCAAVAVALHTVAVTLLDLRLVMAREAALLLVMGDLAFTAANAEEASFAADRSALYGAEAFTDQAVERVVPAAAILVRTRATAHRFWSARAAEGRRPDLLVVPVPILGDTRIALGLLRRAPALQQILRDVSLDGKPGEEALTILADVRPVLVELDPRWERRVVSHLVADHFWLRFAPEPLGASDRRAAFTDLRARFTTVLSASTVDEQVDPSTAAVLRARLTDAALEAALLGDRDEAIALVEQLGKVSSGDRLVAELTQRLAGTKTGGIDIKGLLR